MVASEYYIGGVPLDDPAGRWFVTSETLLPTVSAARAPSVTVPYRSGVLPLPTRTVDPFQVTVKVVVQGGGQGRGGLDRNWHALMGRTGRVGSPVMMQHRPPGGVGRQALVRLTGSVEPTFYYHENMLEASLVFEGVEGVWRDEQPATMAASDLSALKGSPLPVTGALIDVTSPTGVITVQDVASGGTVSWNGTVQAGYSHLVIDTSAYTATFTNTDFGTTGKDWSGSLSIPPYGWAITPDSSGTFKVTASGGSAIRIRAGRCY